MSISVRRPGTKSQSNAFFIRSSKGRKPNVCGGAAAEQYEVAVKDARFGAECQAAGLVLVPMVVEVFGRWGERSLEAFQLVSKAGANRASEKVAAAGNHLRRSMSVGLQRLNARILLSRMDPRVENFSEPIEEPGPLTPEQEALMGERDLDGQRLYEEA